MSGARRFMQTFVSLVGAEAVTRLMLLVSALIVVRALAPAEFGEYAYVIAAASLAALMADLGLVSLVVRDMSADPSQTPFLLGAFMQAQWLMVGAMLALGGVFALTGFAVGPASRVAFFLGFAVYAASALGRPFEATLTATAKAHLVVAARVVRGVVVVAATAIVAATTPSPEWLLVAALSSELAGTATVAAICLRRAARPILRGGMPRMTRLLKLAVPFALLAGFNMLYGRIDLLMLGQLASATEVGNYGLASRVVEAAVLLPAYFGAAYLATVAQTGPDTEQGRGQTAFAVQSALVLCVPLAFALALAAHDMVETLAGSAYAGAGTPLVILSANVALVASYAVLSNLQVALDHVALLVKINLAGVAVKAGLNAWTIPAYGARGAAAAAVAVELLVVIAQWLAVRPYVEMPVLLSVLARVGLCAGGMVLVGVLLLAVAPWPVALAAGLGVFLSVGVLVGSVSRADLRVAFGSLRPRSP